MLASSEFQPTWEWYWLCVLCRPPQATYSTNSPVWEEAFRFFLQDPRSQELDVQVRAASSCLPRPVFPGFIGTCLSLLSFLFLF